MACQFATCGRSARSKASWRSTGKMQRVFVGVFSRIQSKARATWSTVVQAAKLRRIMRGPASSGDVGRSAISERGDDARAPRRGGPAAVAAGSRPSAVASWRA